MDFKDAFVLWRGMDVDYTGGVLSNPARTAIHVTHRIGAVAAGLTLILVGIGIALRSDRRPTKIAAALIVPAVLFQIGIGVSMVYFGMPLPLATLHNAGAALLVICLVSLLRTLWPARTVGVIG
jgi:cytochrome c oxidase assembly protein subunit 15